MTTDNEERIARAEASLPLVAAVAWVTVDMEGFDLPRVAQWRDRLRSALTAPVSWVLCRGCELVMVDKAGDYCAGCGKHPVDDNDPRLWCSCGVWVPDVVDGISRHKPGCARTDNNRAAFALACALRLFELESVKCGAAGNEAGVKAYAEHTTALEQVVRRSCSRREIVTYVGSMRFHAAMQAHAENAMATSEVLVLLPEQWPVTSGPEMPGVIHRRKIQIADRVFVFNRDDYIGDDTQAEIGAARLSGKPISYLEPPSPSARSYVSVQPSSRVTVNGVERTVPHFVDYEMIVHLANGQPHRHWTVVYHKAKRGHDISGNGTLTPGCDNIEVQDGTAFDVADTSRA